MIDADGTLCWRLLLVANSLTVWWAWCYRGPSAGQRWPHVVAVAGWAIVLATIAWQCGPAWAVAAFLASAACGVACAALFRRLRGDLRG